MQQKKKCKDYAGILAKKHGITKAQARAILVYFTSSMATEMINGNDIRIPMFAHIYFDKEYTALKIKKRQQDGKQPDKDL